MIEPEQPRPSLRLRIAIGFALMIVLVAGIVTAVVKTGNGGSSSAAPPQGPSLAAATAISTDYYLAVKRDDTRTAYSLLCGAQQNGYAGYVSEVRADIRTGTGIASFELTGGGRVRGLAAGVPANIALANGEQTPILVLLTYDGSQWRVCSSNLGGVLPGPGTGSSPQKSSGPTV